MLPDSNRAHGKKENPFLFYGLLLYLMIYYSQVGSRIPALGRMRVELVVGGIILLAAIRVFIKKITHNEEEKRILYPIYLFFAAAAISIPTTVAGHHAIDGFVLLFKSFSVFIMIYVAVITEKGLEGLIYVLLIMAGLVIVEPFFLSLSGRGVEYFGSGLRRLTAVTGLFGHPNALGGFSAGVLPLVYFVFWHEKSWIKKLALLALGLITLRVIMLTESRSAFVGAMSFVVFIWIVSRRKVVTAIVIFVAVVVGWSLLDTTTRKRYSSILTAHEVAFSKESGGKTRRGSMASRYEIITDGIELFSERPITGYGIGGYQIARQERFGRWEEAHNAYVQCLAEVGIVGFIPWLLILIGTFRLLGNVRKIIVEREQIDHYGFMYQMTYALQGYLVVHFSLSVFGHSPYDNYWWIPAGISLAMINILKENELVGVNKPKQAFDRMKAFLRFYKNPT